MARHRSVDTLRVLLAASGVPYEIARSANCHKVKIAGRLVQTVPVAMASTNHRADANAEATVRRAIRQYLKETAK